MLVMQAPAPALDAFLFAHGLAEAGERPRWHALSGGVSSDIWRVDLRRGSVCVKRALPKLRVAAEWYAPVDRNAYEWAWLGFAARVCPGHVPTPLAHDAQAGLFAMEYLAPEQHPVWKQQLLEGVVEPSTAAAVGDVLGRIHAASAARPEVAAAFDSTTNFRALRLEPYLLATAARHPDLAQVLHALAERTAATRIALVHGDVSPKNILVGPNGPVFLDAECAWYGEPAFDLAFCLNHLLLKAIAQPACGAGLRASFDALAKSYLARVEWEAASALEARAAALLPGLLLARCDGKSPVEYLTREADRERLRGVARPLLLRPVEALAEVASAWFASAWR